MCCYNPFIGEEGNKAWEDKYKSSKLGDKIDIFYQRFETQQDVAKLMMQVDCGVFPARTEGWNLELLEMMSMGKQVITTTYSGHTEYCNRANSFSIDIRNVEPALDGIWFKGQGEWAEIDDIAYNQLVDYMRLIHEQKQKGHCLLNTAGIETAKKFTWENTVKAIVEVLHEKTGDTRPNS
jgi:glycosyltransferase involved in cell wall biosynthesis